MVEKIASDGSLAKVVVSIDRANLIGGSNICEWEWALDSWLAEYILAAGRMC